MATKHPTVKQVTALVNKGWTDSHIADHFGVGKSTIGRRRREVGLEPSQPHVTTNTSAAERLAFGSGPQDPATKCIPWLKATDRHGYGYMQIGGRKNRGAYVVALELKLGRRLVPGEIARHKCDNPNCVNKDHLEPGTRKDNTQDMLARGRSRWDRNADARATLRAKAAVLRGQGLSFVRVGAELGVNQATVHQWEKHGLLSEKD